MADVPPPEPPPPDPNNPGDPNATSENEIDKLLAEATALAEELMHDLGMPKAEVDEDAASDSPVLQEDQTKDVTESLDDELSQLDGLLTKTGADVGVVSDAPAAVEHAAEAAPDASESVPGFMDEFTRPEESKAKTETPTGTPTPPGPEPVSPPSEEQTDASEQTDPPGQSVPTVVAGQTPVATPRKVGVVSTADLGPAGKVSSFPPKVVEDQPPATEETHVAPEAATSPAKPTIAGKVLAILARVVGVGTLLAGRLSPPAAAACERGVRVLEGLDRPLGRIGPRIRRVIGWLGMATVGTSLLVYLVSLF